MLELTPDQIAKKQEQLREEIRQREELLKAYDLVAQDMSNNGTELLPFAEQSTIPARHRTRIPDTQGYGRITRIVRKAINEMHKPFTLRDIQRNLVNSGTMIPIQSVTTVVNRLRSADNPEIRVRAQGSGRRATIYEKT